MFVKVFDEFLNCNGLHISAYLRAGKFVGDLVISQ